MRDRLIKARGKRTQTAVATAIGISQKHLSKLEIGDRNPSLKLASSLSAYYKSSVEELFPDIFAKDNYNME